MRKQFGRKLLFMGLTAIFLFSTIKSGEILLEYIKGDIEYRKLEKSYKIIPDDNTVLESASDFREDIPIYKRETESGEKNEPDILYPPVIDHAGLLAENGEYVGWLEIESCGISLPVVLGESNSAYIHTSFHGGYLYQGTLFADWHNRRDLSDPHTVIYGHNMKNRSMFGSLRNFLDADFLKANPEFWLCTSEGSFRYRIYSVSRTSADSDAYMLFPDYGYGYAEYISNRIASSYEKLEVIPDTEARTLTLSTCSNGSEEERIIVQAYRCGIYPEGGCCAKEAEENEKTLREKENEKRIGYVMPSDDE